MSRAGRSRRPRAQGMGAAGPAAMGAGRPPTVRRQSLQDFLGSRLGRGSEGEIKVNSNPRGRRTGRRGLPLRSAGFA